MSDEPKEPALIRYQDGELEIDVILDGEGETVWASRAQMAVLFGVTRENISMHIKNILAQDAALSGSCKEILHDPNDARTRTQYYNLDVIVPVGYRVTSPQASKFQRWANRIIRDYLIHGAALNEERLRNDPAAANSLAAKVRELRSGEIHVYEAVRRVFKMTATDYEASSPAAKKFFALLQDKFLVAATEMTAAELILKRADHNKPNMGLIHIRGDVPDLVDARAGKNYCVPEELYALHLLCEQFLMLVESKALRKQTLTMKQLANKFDALVTLQEQTVFKGYKAALAELAYEHAKTELAAYKELMGILPKSRSKKAIAGKAA